MEERLQKILAQAGFGSRRSCEELITAQRVRVNGKIAVLGSRADAEKDSISVDGQGIPKIGAHMYIALNKPRDVLSDIDPEDPRQTVHDLVKVPGHLFAVGRLDYESEGLILLTNDGELANRLTHPRYGHEKEYRVLVGSRPDDEQLAAWRRGVVLADGVRTRPAEVFIDALEGRGAWLRVVLREGRKRQIREVGGRIGLHVLRILRVRIGTLLLGDLKVGEWRHLTQDEVHRLQSTVEKPVRNLTPRSTFGQPRYERRPASGAADEGRTERRPSSRRDSDSESGRSERRPGGAPKTGGDRSEWKPARPSQAGPATGRRGAGSERSSQNDEERREWRPLGPTKAQDEHSGRGPAVGPRGGSGTTDRRPVARPDHAAPESDRKPRSWQKPAGKPADRHGGGRPETHSNRPAGRSGGRSKGPRTSRS
jgi:23S rRNA pseudouridine2605 synthase